MDAYDSKTASSIVGVSLRQQQYWDERDFIRPSVKLADGRGTKRLYSFHGAGARVRLCYFAY